MTETETLAETLAPNAEPAPQPAETQPAETQSNAPREKPRVVYVEAIARCWVRNRPGDSACVMMDPAQASEPDDARFWVERHLVSPQTMAAVEPSDPPASGEKRRYEDALEALEDARQRRKERDEEIRLNKARRSQAGATAEAIAKALGIEHGGVAAPQTDALAELKAKLDAQEAEIAALKAAQEKPAPAKEPAKEPAKKPAAKPGAKG